MAHSVKNLLKAPAMNEEPESFTAGGAVGEGRGTGWVGGRRGCGVGDKEEKGKGAQGKDVRGVVRDFVGLGEGVSQDARDERRE